MVDQMRSDSFGTATPHLNKLIQDSVNFSQCFTTSPICAPARASLLMGKYPHQMGIVNNGHHILQRGSATWVQDLRDAGYETSVFGKTHYYTYDGTIPDMREAEELIRSFGFNTVNEVPGPRVAGRLLSHLTQLWHDQGLIGKYNADMKRRYGRVQTDASPTVLPFELYPDNYVGEKGYEYLEGYASEKPFFTMVSFPGPHDPWDAPLSYHDKIADADIDFPLPDFVDANPDRNRGDYDKDLDYERVSDEEAIRVRKGYLAKISVIDEKIGSILQLLKDRDMYDNTVVVFVADHGEMCGDRGRLYKSNFLDSSVRIPLLIKKAGSQRQEIADTMVEIFDVGPTLLDLAGVPIRYEQEGRSVFSHEHKEYIFSELDGETMVLTQEWKLVANKEIEPYMLFDRQHDLNEMHNLACTGLAIEKDLLLVINTFFRQRG